MAVGAASMSSCACFVKAGRGLPLIAGLSFRVEGFRAFWNQWSFFRGRFGGCCGFSLGSESVLELRGLIRCARKKRFSAEGSKFRVRQSSMLQPRHGADKPQAKPLQSMLS